ncbi:hypothetical protein C900_00953 [Fulvivirga imtechensis AK7]|uniref:Thiol-disulfide oxidoreductase n=1 Tax=Fulvivirga imtechensis AK7 TaxID=1237149 RepID=L8JIL6_9BACT|nr:DCC1-like thiol-disulfide oxidoreductase family protein [Fulvivirga imtechensis]ELR68103.1 hypothetical protein C900_00953 [Fulvivirga imtechensis AK7]
MGTFDQVITDKDIILFDGVCNLCNGAVNFVLDRDPDEQFFFASLQSQTATTLLKDQHYDHTSLKSIIVITKEGKLLTRSDAALYVAGKLKGGWKLMSVFKIIPTVIRDFVYDIIARYRYTLFGKRDQCRIPTPELRQRFLDAY